MGYQEDINGILEGLQFGNPTIEEQIQQFLSVVEHDVTWQHALVQSHLLSDGHLVYAAWALTPTTAPTARNREYVAQIRVVQKGNEGWIVCPWSPCGEDE